MAFDVWRFSWEAWRSLLPTENAKRKTDNESPHKGIMATIRIGTSGFSFPTWKGPVYPSGLKDSGMFQFYVDQLRFNTVEINYTYYRQPAAKTLESLAKRTPPGFDFTVKLFGGLTHDPWKDFPPTRVDKAMCEQFLHGVMPLVEAGKLGCLLAQFPGSLRSCAEAWGYLSSLPEYLGGLPLVYEFRNKGWISDETFAILGQLGIGFCAVDEPQLGALMPLVPGVTSGVGYLRLHGRSKNWFKKPELRYDYLYSEQELREFLPAIESMAARCQTLYIAFNNCHAGAAARNAKMMQQLMGMDAPGVQGSLMD